MVGMLSMLGTQPNSQLLPNISYSRSEVVQARLAMAKR
jgi:hypothetical protein